MQDLTYSNLAQLHELDWQAIHARQWQNCKEGKQAEFLIEQSFPWHLVESIVVQSQQIQQQVVNTLQMAVHQPPVTINTNWYY